MSSNNNNNNNKSDNNNNNNDDDNLSLEIEKYYTSTRPYSEEVIEKEKLCKYIIDCGEYLQRKCEKELKQQNKLKNMKIMKYDGFNHKNREKSEFLYNMSRSEKYFDKWDIFVFGSESWGTSCRDSDIDMGIFVNFKNMRPDKKYLLSELAKIIGENDNDGLLLIKPILSAKYPIIRITQSKLNIKIDVSIADRFCKSRDQLIAKIIKKFEIKYKIPIKKLIVFIKYWSKCKKINNSYQCFLNSFSYTLLTIKFLQFHIFYDKQTNISLSYLVYKFFEFYSVKYKSEIHSISICDSNHSNQIFVPKQYNKEINGYCLMEIRDPVDPRNNVAQRIGYYQLQRIKQEFKNAFHTIKRYNLLKKNNLLFNLLTEPPPSSFWSIAIQPQQTQTPQTASPQTPSGSAQSSQSQLTPQTSQTSISQPIIIQTLIIQPYQQYLHQFFDEQQDQNYRDALYDKYASDSNHSISNSNSNSNKPSVSTSISISDKSDKSSDKTDNSEGGLDGVDGIDVEGIMSDDNIIHNNYYYPYNGNNYYDRYYYNNIRNNNNGSHREQKRYHNHNNNNNQRRKYKYWQS